MIAIDLAALRLRSPRQHSDVVGPLTLQIATGEVVGVVGRSGSGKSLLLCALAGLAPAAIVAGTARVARPVAMSFANDALDDGDSALENVALAARAADMARPDDAATAILLRLGIDATTAARRPRSLSGGQRRRVGVARALVVAPRVLLLDDPTAGLDPATARSLLATVRAVAPDAAILVATQDVDVVLPLANRAVLLGGEGECRARDVRDLPPPFAPVAFASFLPDAQP